MGTDDREKIFRHFKQELLVSPLLFLRLTRSSIFLLKEAISTRLDAARSLNLALMKNCKNQTGAVLWSGILAPPCIWMLLFVWCR